MSLKLSTILPSPTSSSTVSLTLDSYRAPPTHRPLCNLPHTSPLYPLLTASKSYQSSLDQSAYPSKCYTIIPPPCPLFLGPCGIPMNQKQLTTLNVTFILSLARELPPPRSVREYFTEKFGGENAFDERVLHIPLDDHERQTISQDILDAVIKFLDRALSTNQKEIEQAKAAAEATATDDTQLQHPHSNGDSKSTSSSSTPSSSSTSSSLSSSSKAYPAVYVHCLAGKSRSATIVLYYLMYRFHRPLCECYEFLRQLKEDIAPNLSFFRQLCQYEEKLFGGISSVNWKDYLAKELIGRDHRQRIADLGWNEDKIKEICEKYEFQYSQIMLELYSIPSQTVSTAFTAH